MDMIEIGFSEQMNGYDKGQVDAYIRRIAKEYVELQREYELLNSQYDQLQRKPSIEKEYSDLQMKYAQLASEYAEYRNLPSVETEYRELHKRYAQLSNECNELKAKFTEGIHKETLSKAIMDAETRAVQIIETAKHEEERIIGRARIELSMIQQERSKVIEEIVGLMARLQGLINR